MGGSAARLPATVCHRLTSAKSLCRRNSEATRAFTHPRGRGRRGDGVALSLPGGPDAQGRGRCTPSTNSAPSAVDGPQNRRRTKRRRGNTDGTIPRAPNGARRTRRTVLLLKTIPGVLDDTGATCGPPFGTKRPQVQILSPRLTSSQVTALRKPPWLQPSAARGNKKEH